MMNSMRSLSLLALALAACGTESAVEPHVDLAVASEADLAARVETPPDLAVVMPDLAGEDALPGGWVHFTYYDNDAGSINTAWESSTVQAFFHGPGGAVTQTVAPPGGCVIFVTPFADNGGVPLSVGDVNISDGQQQVVLVPVPTNLVYPAAQLGWTSGETLSVSARGDQAPGFSLTLPAPDPIELMSPAFDANGVGYAPANQDLVLVWKTGIADDVQMDLFVFDPGRWGVQLTCTFVAAPGTAVVPWSVIEDYSQRVGQVSGMGPSNGGGWFNIYSKTTSSSRIGDFLYTASASRAWARPNADPNGLLNQELGFR
jgi:hypothetical protein